MVVKDKCKCCGKDIIITANQKYCTNCSLTIGKLVSKIGALKHEVKKLKIELYGTDDKRMLKIGG